ncbi:translational GTPase TypA [Ktedonosporobacter rubrisoli]|uniref:Large ribosomal subunit assembly factor BipA n=1 Tax=Ktedonosporobacter rubrisoli TaxID=2509675 RepID=A0A4P6JS70_KTERU|nr:translational GTPase TypA [Ktedonosporobacter rubrisoli]QBD78060.1 translational GTPase TypA [Ktedonosporobacter rubrisoli]
MQTKEALQEDSKLIERNDIRNVAIIAHVDHGKTTLVDGLLKQSHIFRDNQQVGELIMDSNDQERERGITILAKNTAVNYRGIKINIIDTPGHADFGGEVERVLNMADGCILLIDAVEGPMPQTRFVLQKALELNLQPIVVVNKIDRRDARIDQVLEWTQDLFLELATRDEHLNFPVLYAIGRDGVAMYHPDDERHNLEPLFETIINTVPAPKVDTEAPLQMLIAALDYDDYKGKYAIGRIVRGRMTANTPVAQISREGEVSRQKVSLVFTHKGLQRVEVPEALAGDIVAITGISSANIGETIADLEVPEALPTIAISEPTLKMTFGVNSSPFAGREGKFSTSRQLRARLYRELETNVSLRVEDGNTPDEFVVSGRGELHLSVLIEAMRREGYEFQVSRPEVITREDENGHLLEPIEHLVIDTKDTFIGVLTETLAARKAQLMNMTNDGLGNMRLEYSIPTRGLIGFRNAFLTLTKGNGAMSSRLLGFEPWLGKIGTTRMGALIASEQGVAVTYGLSNAQQRGDTFIEPGTPVYEGMIVGLNSRPMDMVVNVCKEKQKTNIRSSTSDIAVRLTPPVLLSLEQSLDFINNDELVEVTPQNIRLRKRYLTQKERARARELE